MSNLNEFWGSAKERFESKRGKKLKILPKIDLKGKVWPFLKLLPTIIKTFFLRLTRLPFVLNKRDKLIILILFVVLSGLVGYKYYREYIVRTKIVPAVGGTYEEILIGEVSYLNPVLARNDTDKTIDSLLYSGLVKINKDGDIVPDLAASWDITDENKTYIFHLRNDVYWHDGMKFTSADVAHTIEEIKDQNIKSPYFQAWSVVTVEVPDESTVIFKLNSPYGPFIYNATLGIIPSHIDSSSLSSLPIGTGPYKFFKALSDKNKNINQVTLVRNDNYWLDGYYIKYLKFHIVADETTARKSFKTKKISAVANLLVDGEGIKNFSFPTSRHFGLIFNLNSDKFKNEAIRKKVKSDEKFDPELEFKLTILDKPLYITQADEIKNHFTSRGIKVDIDKRSPIDFQSIIEKGQFEAILYGFDSGYDRDPYPFWHTSQIGGGMNYSGFSDKSADILLEDARMTVDTTIRNQKYDEFFNILNDKVPVIFYPDQIFTFSIKDNIQGVDSIGGREPWDHLNNLSNWYIKIKRIKP